MAAITTPNATDLRIDDDWSMIKSNELRLGNYYDQFGNIHQANWVTIKDLSQAPEGQLWCKPIPLTEDWLKRFGFEKGNWLYSSGYCIQILKTDFYLRPCYLGGFYWGFNMDRKKNDCELNDAQPIQYVHQLQNLYFALTQTELTPSDGGKIE